MCVCVCVCDVYQTLIYCHKIIDLWNKFLKSRVAPSPSYHSFIIHVLVVKIFWGLKIQSVHDYIQYTHTCLCIYIYIYIYVCVCVCVCTCIYIYTLTHSPNMCWIINGRKFILNKNKLMTIYFLYRHMFRHKYFPCIQVFYLKLS